MTETKKQKNIVPLKDLNLTDRFLFDEVMEDPQAQQAALSIIFGRDIPLLSKNETEKELRVSPLLRSIRMDVYTMDKEKIIYNTEMQNTQKNDLIKRSRYYQALIDSGLLEPGVPNYNLLNDSFIIMIMPFDLFGFKKYCYTFHAKCSEIPDLILADGTTRIFLNTKGKNPEEVSPELVDFLYYIENTTDEVAAKLDNPHIKYIHNRVCKVKASEKIGVKYMQAWEERYYAKQEAREEELAEGRAEGRAEGFAEGDRSRLITQIKKKLAKGTSIDTIANEVEESIKFVEQIITEIYQEAPLI